jgi:intein/homing endonuclease
MDDMLMWAYLAGFTDGDGCIAYSIKVKKGVSYLSVVIRWAQKESESTVLDWISDFLLVQGIKPGLRRFSVARSGHQYPQRELGIRNNDDARLVLRGIAPYLVVKRQRGEEALAKLEEIHALRQQYGPRYRLALIGCSYDGCAERYFSSGMCRSHYGKERYARSKDRWNAARRERYAARKQ